MAMFSSLLVANRGEIACRIFRTARRLGMRTVAVYSDADRQALHTRLADEAHLLGPAEARLSYLDKDRLIGIAREAQAAAVHPGYGFLAENAEFAEACKAAGLIFVGPSPAAIRTMGLKDRAKAIAARAGVPVIPGYAGTDQADAVLRREAGRVGFPVIIKAVAGGGGKGMRIVGQENAFQSSLDACRREARAAFGDDGVLLEKYFTDSRHIEVQVMADRRGNVIHLFERDCSIQRRHQKIIEEAPAFGLTEATRSRMHAAAVSIAREVAYEGAGTIEFLYDPREDAFYFMEMNTRLQVEHPVSEMITGFDFVELQLRVAAGEALPVAQADVTRHGHAVEARLYAEDPSQGFLPQTGRILDLQWPASSGDLRIETGVEQGSRISPYYDPMIAKLVAHGHDRGSATERLRHALRRTTLFGLKTNKGFLEELLAEPGFPTTTLATQFIDQRRETLGRPPRHLTLFGIVAWLWRLPPAASLRPGWTLDGMGQHLRLKLAFQGVVTDVLVGFGNNELALTLGDSKFNVTDVVRDGIDLSFRVEGEELAGKALAWASAGDVYAELAGYQVHVAEPDYQHLAMVPGSGGGVIRAPMPGRVLRLDARAGGKVEPGQNILILEAMKMEHVMTAPTGGTVMELTVREGEQVREGDVLCRIEAAT
jgi:3-methylcrotonyl-CoA carboxylase alpha subunit